MTSERARVGERGLGKRGKAEVWDGGSGGVQFQIKETER